MGKTARDAHLERRRVVVEHRVARPRVARGAQVEDLQLGLQLHNNLHNLQIPISSIELAVVWGGQGTEYPWKPEADKRRPGYDETSRVVDRVPSPAEIVGWAKELLMGIGGGGH